MNTTGLLNAIKSGATTAIALFLGMFVPSLVGWLTSLQSAVSNGHAAVAAAVAAVTGFAWGLFRYLQTVFPWIPGTPPSFAGTPSSSVGGPSSALVEELQSRKAEYEQLRDLFAAPSPRPAAAPVMPASVPEVTQ